MNIKWKDWLQVGSNIALLSGILFIYLEIQQTQILTRAQLSSEAFSGRADLANSLMGESPEVVLDKACNKPDELSSQDRIVMAQIFQSRLQGVLRSVALEKISGLGITYESNTRSAFSAIFNYEYGKDFYSRLRATIPEEIRSIGDEVLSNLGASDCAEGSTIYAGF